MGHSTVVSVRDDDHRFVLMRRVWRYQRGTQNPDIKERKSTKGQTTIYKTSVKSIANIDRPKEYVCFLQKVTTLGGF